MEADIHTLFESDFYCIRDFKCRCTDCRTSKPEYNESFCISFVRTGNFLFNVFRHSLDSYTGCVLVCKPGYERTVSHIHAIPDECTIFDFKPAFFLELKDRYPAIGFLQDHDLHSTLVKINPETEYLHYHIWRLVVSKAASKLEIDNLVMEFVQTVFGKISYYKIDLDPYSKLKKNHLITIEKAKDYITRHFTEDVSLQALATYCCVSVFHFSRIFKTLTAWSPHQFLLHVRLKNAEILLKNSSLPVADVAFASGFNSIEHFTAAFSKTFHYAPATFRAKNSVVVNH
jgi:AraC family transcriptional regulator